MRYTRIALISIEELKRAVEAVNTQRAVQGLGAVEVECLLVFNDASLDAIELLKTHVAPMQAEVSQACPKLHLRVEYLNEFFEAAYSKIKRLLEQGRYRSVIFNLDQCGHSHVERNTILDIMHFYRAPRSLTRFYEDSLPVEAVVGYLLTIARDQGDTLCRRCSSMRR